LDSSDLLDHSDSLLVLDLDLMGNSLDGSDTGDSSSGVLSG